jgi:hypothetical protein
VYDVNTSVWTPGTTLYVKDDGSGELTDVPLVYPGYPMSVGQVVDQGDLGSMFIRPRTAEADPIWLDEKGDYYNKTEVDSITMDVLKNTSLTNGYIPYFMNGNLQNSPLFRSISGDELLAYDGDLYIDDSNGLVGVNIVGGVSQSYSQAFVVQSEVHQGIGNITIVGLDYDGYSTGVIATDVLPVSFADASTVVVGETGMAVYVFSVQNSTHFRVRGTVGPVTFTSTNWSWQQAPFIDVNGPSNTERGYSLSSNGTWQWAMYVPDDSNDTKFCIQNRNAWFGGQNNALCIDEFGTTTIYGELLASGLNIGNATLNVGGIVTSFVNATSIYLNGIDVKLYNDTLLISEVNTTANIQSLGFNTTAQLNNLFYSISNPSGFLNGSDQRFNDTALINAVNKTSNIMGLGFYNTSYVDAGFANLENLYAGFKVLPVWTDNGDGSINFTSGNIAIYDNSLYQGYVDYFPIIAGQTGVGGITAIPDGVSSYLVAEYNGGSPRMQLITNRDLIHQSDVVPFLTIYRDGTELYVIDWGDMANGMAEKINDRLVRTERFARETGLELGQNANNTLIISSGVLWLGATRMIIDPVDSVTDGIDIWYHNASGVFVKDDVPSGKYYNNVWDNGTGLIPLQAGQYANVWVYRNVKTPPEIDVIVGHAVYASLAEAITGDAPPVIPTALSSNYVLVGRVSFLVNASSGLVGSAWALVFSNSVVTNHDDLASINGGIAGQFYHLSSSDYTNVLNKIWNNINTTLNIQSLGFNTTAQLNSVFDAAGAAALRAATGTCPSGQLVQNTTTSGVQCVAAGTTYLAGTGLTLSGSTFSLNTTYTGTLYYPLSLNPAGYVNTTLNIQSLGFNTTTQLYGQFLNITDQRYNGSSVISSVNATAVAKASPGTCSVGYVVQNTTTGGVQCVDVLALVANNYYGEMYNNNASAFTMTTQSVWYNMTTWIAGESNDVTINTTAPRMTIKNAGLYLVTYSVSAFVNNNDILQFRLIVNDSNMVKSNIEKRYGNAQAQTWSYTLLYRFNGNSNITLQVLDTTRNGAQITVIAKDLIVRWVAP